MLEPIKQRAFMLGSGGSAAFAGGTGDRKQDMPSDESAAGMCINVGIANHDDRTLSFWVDSSAYEHVKLCVMLCCRPYLRHPA